jgi:hypothetical protein
VRTDPEEVGPLGLWRLAWWFHRTVDCRLFPIGMSRSPVRSRRLPVGMSRPAVGLCLGPISIVGGLVGCRRIPGCGGLVTSEGGLIPLAAHREPLQRRLVALVGQQVAASCLRVATGRPQITVTAQLVTRIGQLIARIGQVIALVAQLVTLVGGPVMAVGTAVGHGHTHPPAPTDTQGPRQRPAGQAVIVPSHAPGSTPADPV